MNEKYRVLGHAPEDARLRIDRHTDKFFDITNFKSLEEVEKRKEELKFNLRMAAGLYPWPDKTPLNIETETVGEFDGYTVKKISFESYPGFRSTGNLYLPSPLKEKHPAILNVLGHFENQRLHREEKGDFPQQLANFAKMGFICLITDMIGRIDNTQISHDYGSDEKDLWSSNGLGVQLWNNIRAMDVLCSMNEVDKDNIGVTGCSGGGSQTLLLGLVDERVKAAAPINMISLQMQGGCRCENAAGLRINTDNTEMCAMLAPRPLFLAGSTGDWTKYLETAELPGVLEAYRQYGAEDMVEHFYQDAGHQYNAKTRHLVYSFFARHLMGCDPKWIEQDIRTDDLSEYTWLKGKVDISWQEQDKKFFEFHKKERLEKILDLSDKEKRKMLCHITGIKETEYKIIKLKAEKTDKASIEKCVIYGQNGEKLPCVKILPENWDGEKICVMLGNDCPNEPEVDKLIKENIAVMSGDLFMTGEFEGSKRLNEEHRFFTTFNYTTDAYRAQDAALFIKAAKNTANEITVRADGKAASAAVCAIAICDGIKTAKIEKSAIEREDFAVPGILALGGIKEILKLAKCKTETF